MTESQSSFLISDLMSMFEIRMYVLFKRIFSHHCRPGTFLAVGNPSWGSISGSLVFLNWVCVFEAVFCTLPQMQLPKMKHGLRFPLHLHWIWFSFWLWQKTSGRSSNDYITESSSISNFLKFLPFPFIKYFFAPYAFLVF